MKRSVIYMYDIKYHKYTRKNRYCAVCPYNYFVEKIIKFIKFMACKPRKLETRDLKNIIHSKECSFIILTFTINI